MKNNYYLLLMLLIVTSSIFSQNKYFTLYDSINSTAISYANIWMNDKIYANSDVNGKFHIKEADLDNQFRVSCIGYKSKTLNLDSASIRLEKDNISLDEVVIIAPKRKQTIHVGKARGSNVLLTTTFEKTMSEFGKSFKIESEKQLYIKKIKFRTASYEEGRTIGVKIYSLNEDDEPYQIISTEKIIITTEKGYNITTYDFKENLMPIPKTGFFVALQTLFIEENKQYGKQNKEWFFYDPSIGAEKDVIGKFYFSQQQEGVWIKRENWDLNIEVLLTD